MSVEYRELTVVDLRTDLRKRGLKTGGVKKELVSENRHFHIF
jgi:hypothetical protein